MTDRIDYARRRGGVTHESWQAALDLAEAAQDETDLFTVVNGSGAVYVMVRVDKWDRTREALTAFRATLPDPPSTCECGADPAKCADNRESFGVHLNKMPG